MGLLTSLRGEMEPVMTLLNAVTATGAGTTFSARGHKFGCTIAYATAAPTVATVKLQGSQDDTTWVDLAETNDVSATAVGFAYDGAVWNYIRGNLSTYTAGSCTGVTMKTLGG